MTKTKAALKAALSELDTAEKALAALNPRTTKRVGASLKAAMEQQAALAEQQADIRAARKALPYYTAAFADMGPRQRRILRDALNEPDGRKVVRAIAENDAFNGELATNKTSAKRQLRQVINDFGWGPED